MATDLLIAKIDESELPTSKPFVLFIGNLSFDVQRVDIKDFFEECNVINVVIPWNKEENKSKGYGYVEFEDFDSMRKAIYEYSGKVSLSLYLLNLQKTVGTQGKTVAHRFDKPRSCTKDVLGDPPSTSLLQSKISLTRTT